MRTIAIIGAGPGLGGATARRFGAEGYSVALVARNADKLESLRIELASDGIDVRAYVADVTDRAGLTTALRDASADLGAIEVLQYSPVPDRRFLRPVLETSVDDLAAATAFSVLAPAAAIDQVLPGMIEQGSGTILFVNGSSAAVPNGDVAGTSTAFAAESAYGAMLHDALAPQHIHVAQLIIPGAIGGGDPLYAPGALADRLWAIHADRGSFRTTVGASA